ncbi:MAG: MFS transporter [Deltaproteobacteria bacterium]|jgi:DHA1 family multidrug resistance protein-like MFS transporter|nr:MFS transporter [Deltaproteobacteria bacterium]
MHRHLLIILLLSVFIALLGIGIIVPVMPVFAESLGAGGLTLGIIIAVFSLTRGFCQPVVGNLSDRWGRKGFLISGLFVYGVVGLMMPAATSLGALLLIRALHGMGSAMIVPVAMAYVADLTPVGQEGRYMGMLNIAIFAGIGSGPLIGGFCTDRWGMASAFYLMAALSFVAMTLIILQMPVAPASPIPTGPRPGVIKSLRTMLASQRTSGILLARMATMIVMVPTMALLPLLMHQWFQATGMQIGMVIAARTLVNAVLQTPCGRLADRVDKAKFLRLGCLVISAVMCLVPLAGNFWVLLGLFVILGSGEAIIWPTLGALATEEGRHYGQGSIMGVFNLAMSAGVFIGAIGAGFTSDWLGLNWSFLLIGILVFALSLFATRLINKEGARDFSVAP